ncbi:unnamed protein product [Phytomonas sp. EM1]|nr:unnamed protein product [Phytomonas sp. EM1]|eukprot:CCW59593.1 unnamed protein product [Phytomonas sp. isolate EM1]
MFRLSLARLALPKDKKELMELVKSLRYRTEAAIMDCTSALKESDGDIDAAIQILHKKGLARAMKKTHRITENGFLVRCVSSTPANGAAIITMCSETDFAARNEHFQKVCLQTKYRFEEMLDRSQGKVLNHPEDATKELSLAMDSVLKSMIAVLGENVRVRSVTPLKIPPRPSEHLSIGSYTHGAVGVEDVGRFVGLVAVEHLRTGEVVQPDVLTSVARHFVATSGAEGSYTQQNFFGSEDEPLGRWLKRHHLRFISSLVMEFGKEPVEHAAIQSAGNSAAKSAQETPIQEMGK